MTANQTSRRLFVASDVRAAFGLWLDPLVPFYLKLIPLLAALYIISPVDLIPDALLGPGELDDLAVFLIALRLFVSLAGRVRAAATSPTARPTVIEGQYRPVH